MKINSSCFFISRKRIVSKIFPIKKLRSYLTGINNVYFSHVVRLIYGIHINLRKFSYSLVNLRNNVLTFSHKLLNILMVVSENSETCNRKNKLEFCAINYNWKFCHTFVILRKIKWILVNFLEFQDVLF